MDWLSANVLCFFIIYSKWSWIFNSEPSGSSNLLFQFGADILNLLFLYEPFM